ncbi:TraR/DksA family transcriptional regulator [Kiloniella sp. b19]|uniref:TraR/DksA family transcriptional regulator n=1 Tax=Kiloniella sp. GXU_MW_B19 TaxID=3141326 RepID=UPI0031D7FF0C
MIDLKEVETRLKARLVEIEGRVDRIESDLREPHSKDWGEDAAEHEGDQVLEELEFVGLEEISAIQGALHRIEKGTYGECRQCGEDIGEARLKALPYAMLCIDCAESKA